MNDEWVEKAQQIAKNLEEQKRQLSERAIAKPPVTEAQKKNFSKAYKALEDAQKFIRDALVLASGHDPKDVG